jgi:hypothetical protein
MLILPKHSINKKSTFLHVLPNAYAILKSNDFKNTIFKNTIFKIALIEIALPNGPRLICPSTILILLTFLYKGILVPEEQMRLWEDNLGNHITKNR